MKVIFAYDGSRCSEATLESLDRIGLPISGEALVISVAEAWLQPDLSADRSGSAKSHAQPAFQKPGNENAAAEALTLANHARQRLQKNLPGWNVTAETACGSPASKILERAEQFKADLILVGAHGHSLLGRFFPGSVSQKILTEARCSVHVGRTRTEQAAYHRILVGFDGSPGSERAAEAVAARHWPDDSEFRLVTATEDAAPAAIGRFMPPIKSSSSNISASDRGWIEDRAAKVVKSLSSRAENVSLTIESGNPREVLVDEADIWNADCIFLGVNASPGGRDLPGSTSLAVAARAHCSVEIVRNSRYRDGRKPK